MGGEKSGTLSTGLEPLDEHLNGGPRSGSLVSLTASPASQGSALLYALMRERPTLYITTLRREDAVRDELDHVFGDEVEYTVHVAGTKNPLRSVSNAIEEADDRKAPARNILIDTMNPLERTGKYNRYVELLNAIKSYLLETGGIALFHCTHLDHQPSLREVTLTASDLVLDLDVVSDKSIVENHLVVPKVRGGEGVREVIKLELGQVPDVDTSRNL